MILNRAMMHWAAAVLAAVALACGPSGNAGTAGGSGPSALRTTALSDDFNSFDSSVWQESNWANGSPFNCGFLPDHIAFSGGAMSLKLDNVPSSEKSYSGAEYRTIDTVSYGHFEVRMRPAKASGIVSSFFTYTDSPWDEIDIEFLGKNTNQVQFNYYVNGTGGHEALVDLGFDASAAYHTYGFDWQPNSINWYVDGALKHSVSGGTLPSHPMQIMMNLWNGIDVDSWLGTFNYSSPLYAYYDSVTYTPGSGGGGGGGTCSSTPSAPTGVSATAISSSQINLSWSAVTPPANCSVTYSVYRNGSQVASGLTGTSYSSTGLSASTTYQFYVQAVDSVGSGNSNTVSATTQPNGGGGGGGTACKAISGGQSGNFNTTGAICFTITGTISGWDCSNVDGRTVTVNGTATTCGKMPLPGSSPYTFSFTAGTYPWASLYWW